MVEAQIGICHKKGAYTLLVYALELQDKFSEDDQKMNPNHLKSAYMSQKVHTHLPKCVCILKQVRLPTCSQSK